MHCFLVTATSVTTTSLVATKCDGTSLFYFPNVVAPRPSFSSLPPSVLAKVSLVTTRSPSEAQLATSCAQLSLFLFSSLDKEEWDEEILRIKTPKYHYQNRS
ncbi:hypothetical protein S245_017910 [Arachis hypogaea]|nr:uncharacterized protein DS421_5g163820 [Arachis hypogaea]